MPLTSLPLASWPAIASRPPARTEPTTSAYRQDLRCFWQWCADHQLVPLAAKRPHLELYLRDLEQRGYAPATVSRRLSTVAGLFKYAVIDELVASNPTLAVTRPHVRWEGQHRTVLHPLEFAAVLSTARQHSATAHALVALLGMLGLRVSETCNAQITDLHYVGGYEVLYVLGKGAKPAEIPTDGRTTGPVLLSAKGQALTRGAASRLLQRVVR